MNTIEKGQAKGSRGEYAACLEDEPAVITDHGKPPLSMLIRGKYGVSSAAS